MTITLDTWQPIVVAIIGLIAAVAPLIWQAREARRAANKAVKSATEIGGKVDELKSTADVHSKQLTAIGEAVVATDGEREEARRKLLRLEQQAIERNNPPEPKRPFGSGYDEQ